MSSFTRVWLAGLLAVTLAVLLGTRLLAADRPQPSGSAPQPAPHPAQGPESVVAPLDRAAGSTADEVVRGVAFRDVTASAGLDVASGAMNDDGAGSVFKATGAGAATSTLGSGRVLLLSSPTKPAVFYSLERGEFTDITDEAGFGKLGVVTASSFADVDSDGDKDLIAGHDPSQSGGQFLSIWLNDDDTFTQLKAPTGLRTTLRTRSNSSQTPVAIRGFSLADYDRDNNLDLLVTDWTPSLGLALPPDDGTNADAQSCAGNELLRSRDDLLASKVSESRLYRGGGDGTFTDVTLTAGLDLPRVLAFTGQFVDLDLDGWLDLVVAGDVCTSRIYRNEQGRFADVTQRTKQSMTPNGMGSAITDINSDGLPDWVVTGISYPTESGERPYVNFISGCSGNRVFVNEGDFVFSDQTDRFGLRSAGWGWGQAWDDFANRGDRQWVVANGFGENAGSDESQAGVYYRHFASDGMYFYAPDGSGEFVDAAAAVGLDDT